MTETQCSQCGQEVILVYHQLEEGETFRFKDNPHLYRKMDQVRYTRVGDGELNSTPCYDNRCTSPVVRATE